MSRMYSESWKFGGRIVEVIRRPTAKNPSKSWGQIKVATGDQIVEVFVNPDDVLAGKYELDAYVDCVAPIVGITAPNGRRDIKMGDAVVAPQKPVAPPATGGKTAAA